MVRRRLRIRPGAGDDVPDDAPYLFRRAVVHAARDVAGGTLVGTQLSVRGYSGDLTDCYKVEVGPPDDPESHRLVYRINELPRGEEEVEVIAILPRECVYDAVALRLGRLAGAKLSAAARHVYRCLGRNS